MQVVILKYNLLCHVQHPTALKNIVKSHLPVMENNCKHERLERSSMISKQIYSNKLQLVISGKKKNLDEKALLL